MEKLDFTPDDEPIEDVETKKPERKLPVPETATMADTEVANVKIQIDPVAAAATQHVVSGNDHDEVLLSRCIYENKLSRKSLSIHHVQRRLMELGYNEAAADEDGYFSENTLIAVEAFRKDKKIGGSGHIDAETLKALFSGDRNVKVIID